MSISIIYGEALTSLGYGRELFDKLVAGESGLKKADVVFDNLPNPELAGMVGTIEGVVGEERIPQILDRAFHRILPSIVFASDLVVGGCSFGDLAGPEAGNPHAALVKAMKKIWPSTIPPTTLVSSACSSGTDAIIVAAQAISSGLANIVTVIGFDSLGAGKLIQHIALGTQSADRARPFDGARSGTSFGEACGVMVLANDCGMKKLKTQRIGRIANFGLSSDSYDIAAPHPEGIHASNAIRMATKGLNLDELGYINVHGSGTSLNDQAEAAALRLVFGDFLDQAIIGGTKGALGHSLGATGVVEAIITLQAMNNSIYPPTTGLLNLDQQIAAPILQKSSTRGSTHKFGLTTTFGFGGVNSALLIEASQC
ncbi:3-oxoacyl-[acyl-carrier-protein] synthase II [Pseudomonas gessardii]|uniref:Ketosynthase family 3 (KS3) domain-containing protein n=1 Tax=Pseudomonas gessardii TaxID=78544 RepID=A0A7Y1QN54_9PSED|nr:beta-ketoacyl synthase N-terminal-like domain-containing protein [Pseudomonas gessardii]MRU52982.1 hypothetical protein [Pseudomonas gessardii]NNA97232.1 hypothetical protein [Pseudomonas gessardii]ONH39043.1 hypothetical protein BLL38_21525 [Pseudomonas gessardii]SDQ67938.1 3-oxoacyl-[acyl-carrier-protein] synthase II [Pseudomonas gessardii]